MDLDAVSNHLGRAMVGLDNAVQAAKAKAQDCEAGATSVHTSAHDIADRIINADLCLREIAGLLASVEDTALRERLKPWL